jgi:hypothetical protein
VTQLIPGLRQTQLAGWEVLMHRMIQSLTLLSCLLAWPAMGDERGSIFVVTHIDVIPTNLDQAVPVLQFRRREQG